MTIATSGQGGGYSVHVHADDAGGAVEAALDIGRPSRIQVTALTGDAGGRPPGGWGRDRAVLAIVDGDGAQALFAGEGAHVLRPDADGPISAQRLLRAIVDADAAQIMVLPNGYLAAEELVAGCTAAIGWGIDVVPVPAASMVQGLAALAVHDAGRQAVDDGYTMARAAAGARHGSVRLATEEALTWAGTCTPGQGLGIAGDEVLIVGKDVADAGAGLIDLLLTSGGELVTVLTGTGVDPGVGEALRAHVHREHLGAELVTYHTGHSRRRAVDRGGVAVVALTDRLDRVIGAKAAGPLDEFFGIRTVDDLLRHYPRKYSDGMTVRGEGEDLELEEGEHVTFVDVITDVVVKPMKRQPGKRQRSYAVVTLGNPQAEGDGDVLQRRLSGQATARRRQGDVVGRGVVLPPGHAADASGIPRARRAGAGQGQQVAGQDRRRSRRRG